MQEDILINWAPQETRVAMVENGVLQELHVERTLERGLVGNVYLGKVARVLPVERRNLLAGIDLRGGEGGRHQSKQELHSSLIVAGQHGGSTNVEPSSMVPTQREFAAGAYGFGAQRYWSSTFGLSSWGTCRYFDDGHTAGCMLLHPYPSRPI
jgi:hypothetical protein